MKSKVLIILLFFCVSLSVMAQGFKAHRGTVSDSYNFWFYDPETTPDPRAHFPLLIFLHGRSLCGNDLNKVKRYGPIDAVAKGRIIDTYILAPQNPGGSWNPEKIWKIVEWAEKNYHVDKTRIYVYGMSLGGYGTMDMAATYPDRIACAFAMCGGSTKKDLSGLCNLPFWIAHGIADEKVPVSCSDRVANYIHSTGHDSRLVYDRIPATNHGALARLFYMRETYDWMFSHSLNDPGRPISKTFPLTYDLLHSKGVYRDMNNNIITDDDFDYYK